MMNTSSHVHQITGGECLAIEAKSSKLRIAKINVRRSHWTALFRSLFAYTMKRLYIRTPRSDAPPDWKAVSRAWQSLMHTSVSIDFQALFQDLGSIFIANPSQFIGLIRKAHHLPPAIPDNFNELDIQGKANLLFAQFRFIFTFDELDSFVQQANFQPSNFRSHFRGDTYTLFASICYLYQSLLYSLKGTPVFAKNAPTLAFVFGKLLIPDGHRHLECTTFHLDHVYVSPVFATAGGAAKKPAFCLIDESGALTIIDAVSRAPIAAITHSALAGVLDGERILFYDSTLVVQAELLFPSVSSASDAFTISLNPPARGFMQLSSFLHSVAPCESISKFFPGNASDVPPQFTSGLMSCLQAPSMEMLAYIFSLPANESHVTADNIEFFLSAMGGRLLPFTRAICHLKWEAAPYGGQLIFRQNSQFTLLCRMLLRMFGNEYADAVCKECRRLLDEHGGKIKAAPIVDDADALAFLDNIWDPLVTYILGGVNKVPPVCRVLNRLLFVRTAGFYVDQAAPSLVLPNLFFLRFLIPPIAEDTTIAYAADPKMRKIASLLSGSLLSLCNGLGWPEDKEPYMLKFAQRMEKYYKPFEEYTMQLIDCQDFSGYDPAKLSSKGNEIQLIGASPKRVVLMNLKDTNRILNSHIFSVSIMHMIEEFVYDFGAQDGLKAN
jgi:hypothetical protein